MKEQRELTPDASREWWVALITNATDLIADAVILADAGSYGRAQSLSVLAAEEVGKARTVFDHARFTWTSDGAYNMKLPDDFEQQSRHHLSKLHSYAEYADQLGPFWGDYSGFESDEVDDRQPDENELKKLNLLKQRGFYVDWKKGDLFQPRDVDSEFVMSVLVEIAQVAEMMLIEDHTDMKRDDVSHVGESTQDLHFMILPIAHAEEIEAAYGDRTRDAL